MPQIVDPAFVRVINARAYAALQTTRRNAGNTAYEFALGIWSDQSYTNPTWIVSIPNTKVTGLGTLSTGNSVSNSDGSITVATGTTNPVVSIAATFQTKAILSGAW